MNADKTNLGQIRKRWGALERNHDGNGCPVPQSGTGSYKVKTVSRR
jgi:hypothetical protein